MTAANRRFSAHKFKAEKLRRAVPAASNYRVGLIAPIYSRRNQNDVFAAIGLSCKNCLSTAIYGLQSVRERTAISPIRWSQVTKNVNCPGPDEEGGSRRLTEGEITYLANYCR